jgi:hypothetical protein
MQTLLTLAITTAMSIFAAAIAALLSALILKFVVRWLLKFEFLYADAYKVSLATGIVGALAGTLLQALAPVLHLGGMAVGALALVIGIGATLGIYATWIVRPGVGPIGLGAAIKVTLGQFLVGIALGLVVLGIAYAVLGRRMGLG